MKWANGWPIYGELYTDKSEGIRPVVCLKSKVELRETENGYEIVER